MKTKVESTTAFGATRCGTTDSNCGLWTQRIRNERQNSSSITGTTSAAPIQRTTTSGQISPPCASSGRKLAEGAPIVIHGASRWIHSANTARPIPAPSTISDNEGQVCATSSPYSRQKYASSAPTTNTVTP